MNTTEAFLFLLLGYCATVAVEIPVLLVGLAPEHNRQTKLSAGLLLTAFTYPVVVLVLPILVTQTWGHTAYLLVAETYAPIAEVLFFRFITNQSLLAHPDRDAVAIILANISSFALGAAGLSSWILNSIRLTLN